MKMGLEVLLENSHLLSQLAGRRVAIVCHPASVNQHLQHSFDLLQQKLQLTAAFGPQHGIRGDKQDNMIETKDFIDPRSKLPIYSLYGTVRRPTAEMLANIDVLLFDLQDLGCRIYTFITTLLYLMEELAKTGKSLVILDRPNPIGREVEGLKLRPGYESFVGAAPIPMRHGLTVAELALYYKATFKLDLDLNIVKMEDYQPELSPGCGWPLERAWVNPSPNAPTLNMARAYPGTVMIEGTTLSEGRGTTRALEQIGAPDLDFTAILNKMQELAPQWLHGAILRECFFEPTFHKHQGKLCHGFHIHTDIPAYQPTVFKPYRLVAILLKSIRLLYPDYPIYRDFPYEYVTDKLAFDVINGSPLLREWIDDVTTKPGDLDSLLTNDEENWRVAMQDYLLY